jgi:hypothetical protein
MAIRIVCINKAGGYHEDPHEAISHLGWVEDGTGKTGRTTRLVMYDWLIQGGDAYVVGGGSRVGVIGAVNSRGTKYVKTVPDRTTQDNLLRLPECGV